MDIYIVNERIRARVRQRVRAQAYEWNCSSDKYTYVRTWSYIDDSVSLADSLYNSRNLQALSQGIVELQPSLVFFHYFCINYY